MGGAMAGSWDLIGPPFLEGLNGGAAAASGALRGLTVSTAARVADAALLGAAACAQGWAGRSP
jgi:hypothetical protein